MFCYNIIKFAAPINFSFLHSDVPGSVLDLEADSKKLRQTDADTIARVIRSYFAPAIHLDRDTTAIIKIVIISFGGRCQPAAKVRSSVKIHV